MIAFPLVVLELILLIQLIFKEKNENRLANSIHFLLKETQTRWYSKYTRKDDLFHLLVPYVRWIQNFEFQKIERFSNLNRYDVLLCHSFLFLQESNFRILLFQNRLYENHDCGNSQILKLIFMKYSFCVHFHI